MAMVTLNLKPSPRELKQFGFIALAALWLLAALVLWRQSLFGFELGEAAPRWAGVIAAMGVLSSIFSLVFPKGNLPLWIVLICLTYPIGMVVSFVVMALIFYGVLMPVGLLFRLMGRDPLCRRFEPEATTYWSPHQTVTDGRRYFRQF